MYMASSEDDKNRRRASGSSHTSKRAHARGSHSPQNAASVPQQGSPTSAPHAWSQPGETPASLVPGLSPRGPPSSLPYAISDFSMQVENDGRPIYHFTRMSSNQRQSGFEVVNTMLWHRQHPEFDFLRPQTPVWMHEERKVIVCDASIKMLTEARPEADLSITLKVQSRCDLSNFESFQSTCRFYDGGNMAPEPRFDGANIAGLKEQHTRCVFVPESFGSGGNLQLAFGSKFWANRILRYQSLRKRDQGAVRRSLLQLTAAQDIYGTKRGTSNAQCFLTVLWRFSLSESSEECGCMTWRAFSFRASNAAIIENLYGHQDRRVDCPWSAPPDQLSYKEAGQLPMEFDQPHHRYTTEAPQLNLASRASIQSDIDCNSISPPTTTTEYSQQSLPLSHSQDVFQAHDHKNDFDLSMHAAIPQSFKPLHFSVYNNFTNHGSNLDAFYPMTGLEDHRFVERGLSLSGHPEVIPTHNVNETHGTRKSAYHNGKSSLLRQSLRSSLQNAAHDFHTYLPREIGHGAHVNCFGGGTLPTQFVHNPQSIVSPGVWPRSPHFWEASKIDRS